MTLRRDREGVVLRCDALLFDLDGTLVDSLSIVEEAWLAWFAALEIAAMSPAQLHGRTARDIASSVVSPGQVDDALALLMSIEASRSLSTRAMPGAVGLLCSLPSSRFGIVTSAARTIAETRIRAAGIPIHGVLVTAEDVERGKPDPGGYLQAARLLKVEPSRCVAFEDSVAGIEAATAAGCMVVGVSGPAESSAQIVLSDFESVSYSRGYVRIGG